MRISEETISKLKNLAFEPSRLKRADIVTAAFNEIIDKRRKVRREPLRDICSPEFIAPTLSEFVSESYVGYIIAVKDRTKQEYVVLASCRYDKNDPMSKMTISLNPNSQYHGEIKDIVASCIPYSLLNPIITEHEDKRKMSAKSIREAIKRSFMIF